MKSQTIKETVYSRTELMLGEEGLEKLRSSHVAVFGVGGVGGFATEALARAGVGEITLIDSDRVSASNINRQIIALSSTVGMLKTEVMMQRIVDINPDIKVNCLPIFFDTDTDCVDFSRFDYVIDAIDSLRAKIHLIQTAKAAGVRIISAMGAGGKLDPTRFRVSDISKTSVCPLAKQVRIELRRRGINRHKVVFSDEPSVKRVEGCPVGSLSFVPSVMGLILAGEVIKELAGAVTP